MPNFNTLNSLLIFGKKHLQSHNIENYTQESLWLLLHAIRQNSSWFLAHKTTKPRSSDINDYLELIYQRSDHIPLQLIMGKATFYGRDFSILPDVFIPRQDTEILIDVCKKKKFKRAIDICSGSGCIAITLALEVPSASIDAVEVSDIAVENININTHHFHCNKNINIIFSNILNIDFHQSYDLIVSNPPYIHKNDIASLPSSVQYYDPENALTDGDDGLTFYRRIFELSDDMLNDGGRIILEFDSEKQSKEIINIFSGYKYTIYNDLSNNPRAIELTK